MEVKELGKKQLIFPFGGLVVVLQVVQFLVKKLYTNAIFCPPVPQVGQLFGTIVVQTHVIQGIEEVVCPNKLTQAPFTFLTSILEFQVYPSGQHGQSIGSSYVKGAAKD